MKRLSFIIICLMAFPAYGATCKISEYRDLIRDSDGNIVQIANEPAPVTQTVTYTTSSQSVAFNAATKFIRVICDAKAHFVIGVNPTATANAPYLAADSAEYFGIGYGASTPNIYEIAFYDGSS